MWNVRRQDLGADIVVLPQRNLVVFHPDLDYSQALGALMAAMPDMNIDVARRQVEKVTPRPHPEPRRWAVTGLRVTLASLICAAFVSMSGAMSPASAVPEFGPNWHYAIDALGIDCEPTGQPDLRSCRNRDGERFQIGGFRHDNGTLYTSTGPHARMIFVFDHAADARHYAQLHPAATLHGRAVIW